MADGSLAGAGPAQAIGGERGAQGFVVAALRIVDGVVVPQGQFDGAGMACLVAQLVESGEAFGQML